LGDGERATEMRGDDRVEVVGRQVGERRVAQLTGVVHDHVDPTEPVDRRIDDGAAARGVGDRVRVGVGGAALRFDLVRDAFRPLADHVVAHDGRAADRERECVRPAESVTGAGDDRDPVVEPDQSGNP